MPNFYDLPPGHTVGSSLYTVFTHYSTPWKSEIVPVVQVNNSNQTDLSMTSASFIRLCKDMPDFMESHSNPRGIRRADIDVIFSKCAPIGSRRLNFENFLEAMNLMAQNVYSEEDPTNAFSKLLVEHVYGAFDHHSIEPDADVFEKILNELGNTGSSTL